MPKNPYHNMPKKMRWCLPVEPWAPNRNHELQTWTMSSKCELWARNRNCELQFSTLSRAKWHTWEKIIKLSKLHRTVQNESRQCRKRLCFFIIYYDILYVFYIICILFLLCFFYYKLFYHHHPYIGSEMKVNFYTYPHIGRDMNFSPTLKISKT